jgi:hypothetical protein
MGLSPSLSTPAGLQVKRASGIFWRFETLSNGAPADAHAVEEPASRPSSTFAEQAPDAD